MNTFWYRYLDREQFLGELWMRVAFIQSLGEERI